MSGAGTLADRGERMSDENSSRTNRRRWMNTLRNTSRVREQQVVAPSNTILVIEDEPDVTDMLRRQLDRAGGYRTITAVDGNSGLKKAREEIPALIVLDLMLPGLSGLEVCRFLRSDAEDQRAGKADRQGWHRPAPPVPTSRVRPAPCRLRHQAQLQSRARCGPGCEHRPARAQTKRASAISAGGVNRADASPR
jgi:CheY-like chemotaxis protein